MNSTTHTSKHKNHAGAGDVSWDDGDHSNNDACCISISFNLAHYTKKSIQYEKSSRVRLLTQKSSIRNRQFIMGDGGRSNNVLCTVDDSVMEGCFGGSFYRCIVGD
mmetsp:Transcript_56773/g.61520  ORF Transcript_56773/g.61520 Transcript_56773/m.61520 type:complete len:106 (+) Transcript_56773:152-469(+)